MKKLNKRQIIILAVAGVFALYAAYELLLAGPSNKKTQLVASASDNASFADALRSDIMSNKITAADTYVAEIAETQWGKNPFWDATSYREFVGKGATNVKAGPSIVYSGYVDTGQKKMAIINGWEYEAGQPLDVEGYLLKKVTPSRVLIVNRTTGGETYVTIQE
jgi:hypothetical protein